MNTEARDKVTEILGFAPSFESETIWVWETAIGEFRLAPIIIDGTDGSFIAFIHNSKAGPWRGHVCPGINEIIEITTQYKKKMASIQADIDSYLRVMYDIKWRTEIIGYMVRGDHPNRDISLLPLFMKVETIALHIRTVIEFIALASLAANKPLFEQEGDNFKEFWKAKLIFKDIEKKNPDFYPKPIEPIHMTDIEDISRNIRFIEDGYMTRDKCVEVYDKCCEILHPQNPFAEDQNRNYEDLLNQFPDWINLIKQLLNYHVFRLVGSNDFYVLHMHDDVIDLAYDGRGISHPFMYPLQLDKLPSEIQAKLRGERETE